jgi:hypothetical protein
MKERIGDAFFWVLGVFSLIFGPLPFWGMGLDTPVLERLFFCFLTFVTLFAIGWLIRYVFTGRMDIQPSPTKTPK